MQVHCHRSGYICRIEPEKKQFRLLLFKDGLLYKKGELVELSEIPKAYEAKYRAIYQFLTKQ
jgi:hypothetical protein